MAADSFEQWFSSITIPSEPGAVNAGVGLYKLMRAYFHFFDKPIYEKALIRAIQDVDSGAIIRDVVQRDGKGRIKKGEWLKGLANYRMNYDKLWENKRKEIIQGEAVISKQVDDMYIEFLNETSRHDFSIDGSYVITANYEDDYIVKSVFVQRLMKNYHISFTEISEDGDAEDEDSWAMRWDVCGER